MIILGYINSPHTSCVLIYLPWTLLWSSFSIIKSHSANIPSLHNRAPTTSCLKQWSHNIWHKPPNHLVKINIIAVTILPLCISQSRSLSSSNLRNGSIKMLPVFSSFCDEPHNTYICPDDSSFLYIFWVQVIQAIINIIISYTETINSWLYHAKSLFLRSKTHYWLWK